MTIDEGIKNLEYGTKQLEMELESGLWTKGSESELSCKEGIALNKQHIEWLTELRAYRKLRICSNCRHYVNGTTHFGECHVTSDIEPCVVSVDQTACDTFFDYKDF